MRGQKYKDTDDTDSTDDFKKHFAYICAYTYAKKSLEITVSSVSVFRERFENVSGYNCWLMEDVFFYNLTSGGTG